MTFFYYFYLDICYDHYENYNFYKVADAVMATLRSANLFFETLKPWELKKSSESLGQLNVVLHLAMETLRTTAIILKPIVPNISHNLLNKLNIPENQQSWMNIKDRTWSKENFKSIQLNSEKMVLFKRILSEEEKVKKKNKSG